MHRNIHELENIVNPCGLSLLSTATLEGDWTKLCVLLMLQCLHVPVSGCLRVHNFHCSDGLLSMRRVLSFEAVRELLVCKGHRIFFINCEAMGLARFIIYPWLIFCCVGRERQTPLGQL